MKNKNYLVIFLILISISCSIGFADEVVKGPYNPSDGLKNYQSIAKGKIYHLGDDNPFEKAASDGGYSKFQCTWFCFAVTQERMPLGNAYEWYDQFATLHPDRVGSEPRPGAICVWNQNFYKDGHVGKVTKLNPDGTFETWECNRQRGQITCYKITDRSNITGFIYPLGEEENIAKFTITSTLPQNLQKIKTNEGIRINFNQPFHDDYYKGIPWESYLSVTSKLGSKYSFRRDDYFNYYSTIVFEGPWLPGDEITITVKKELCGKNGAILDKDCVLTYFVEKKQLLSTGPSHPASKQTPDPALRTYEGRKKERAKMQKQIDERLKKIDRYNQRNKNKPNKDADKEIALYREQLRLMKEGLKTFGHYEEADKKLEELQKRPFVCQMKISDRLFKLSKNGNLQHIKEVNEYCEGKTVFIYLMILCPERKFNFPLNVTIHNVNTMYNQVIWHSNDRFENSFDHLLMFQAFKITLGPQARTPDRIEVYINNQLIKSKIIYINKR